MTDEIYIAMLESMCRAAAAEIRAHWEAHCNSEGYGPINLVSRLEGNLPPDFYPAHMDAEDINKWVLT